MSSAGARRLHSVPRHSVARLALGAFIVMIVFLLATGDELWGRLQTPAALGARTRRMYSATLTVPTKPPASPDGALSALLASAEAAAMDVRGSAWQAYSWPLTPAGGGAACAAAAPAGGGVAYSEFQTRLSYASHDRMGERALLEPSLRLVHLLAPMAGAAADARGQLDWPHMLPRDLAAVCGGDAAALRSLRPEFLPPGGCRVLGEEGTAAAAAAAVAAAAAAPPHEGAPWCTDWRARVYVAEVACGMTEVNFRGGRMAYAVHAESGAMLSHKRMLSDWAAPADELAPHIVLDLEALATPGYSEYPGLPGHFVNEVLPRLLHLDAVLPADVPLLWPPGAVPDAWAALLRAAGMLAPGRKLLRDSRERVILRARRLYFYGSPEPLRVAPVVTWVSQVQLAERLRAAWLPAHPRRSILLLGRTGARTLTNSAALAAAARARFPQHDFVQLEPSTENIDETAAAVRAADVIVSPHGAGLNNLVFARAGTAVVEIGFVKPDFHLPSDYLCFARNLGLPYWMVLSAEGSQGGNVTIDVEHTLDALDLAVAAAAAAAPPLH